MDPKDLHRLGYSPLWEEYGLLSEKQLRQQLADLDKGIDEHTEHYRYTTFRHFILQTPLTTDVIRQLFALISVDPDQVMATSMAIDLLKTKELSPEDFSLVAELMLAEFGTDVQKYIDRERARRNN